MLQDTTYNPDYDGEASRKRMIILCEQLKAKYGARIQYAYADAPTGETVLFWFIVDGKAHLALEEVGMTLLLAE